MRSDRYCGVPLCTAPCMSVNTLNSIRCAMGSQWSSLSAAVMLRWSRRSIHRRTRAAARYTISSRCNSVPVIPNNAAFPKSSVDVTSACTSVLHAKGGRDDRIRAIFRNRPYAVPHTRVTCVVIDIVQSRYTQSQYRYIYIGFDTRQGHGCWQTC